MAFFRNREIKRFSALLLAFFVAAVSAGFAVGAPTGIFSAALCASLYCLFFLFTRRRYKLIEQLSENIDAVLHGEGLFDAGACDEGELSILRSEIFKMTARLKEQADALKRDKLHLSDAMADIAHQLRTPLTSVNMIVSFLGDGGTDAARRKELVRELEVLLSRIEWLISSLLKISKIDTGTAVFKKESVPVRLLLEKAAAPLLIPLELKGVGLRVSCGEDVRFTGDLNWTAEAVGNIIKNCMENTGSGGTVDVSCSQNAIFTEIVIKDDGEGIDEADLPHIFERFYQGKNAGAGNFGIGLSLCRMILARQNGAVKAANNPSGGARFAVRFYNQVM